MNSYISNKLDEEKNIIKDTYFYKKKKKYVINEKGFRNKNELIKLKNYDFYHGMSLLFPNYYSFIMGFASLPFIFGIIIFSITRLRYKDEPNKNFEGDFHCVCCAKGIVIIFFYFHF